MSTMSTLSRKITVAIAGAGCGKTYWLLESLNKYKAPLLFTFTKTASAIAKSRGIAGETEEGRAMTVHAAAYAFLKAKKFVLQANHVVSLSTVFTHFSPSEMEYSRQGQSNQAERKSAERLNVNVEAYLAAAILNYATGEVVWPTSTSEVDFLEPDIIPLFNGEKYINALIKQKHYTFSTALHVICVKKWGAEFKDSLGKYDALAVDECQDLASPMFDLIGYLSRSADTFLVGDPRQAIYQVNGSRLKYFRRFIENASASENKEFKYVSLPVNRRSSTAVIDYVNELAAATLKEVLGTEFAAPLEAFREDVGEVTVVKTDNEAVAELSKLLAGEEGIETTAWLCHTNSQCRETVKSLREKGFNAVHNSAPAAGRRTISDISLYFNSLRGVASMYLLKDEFRSSVRSKESLGSIYTNALYFLKWMGAADIKVDFGVQLAKVDLRRDRRDAFSHVKYRMMSPTSLNKQLGDFVNELPDCNNMKAFAEVAWRLICENAIMPPAVVEWGKKMEKYDQQGILHFLACGIDNNTNKPTNSMNIVVSTIHNAKGLEFDVVVTTQKGDDPFVNYVGATRARDYLVVIQPEKTSGESNPAGEGETNDDNER